MFLPNFFLFSPLLLQMSWKTSFHLAVVLPSLLNRVKDVFLLTESSTCHCLPVTTPGEHTKTGWCVRYELQLTVQDFWTRANSDNEFHIHLSVMFHYITKKKTDVKLVWWWVASPVTAACHVHACSEKASHTRTCCPGFYTALKLQCGQTSPHPHFALASIICMHFQITQHLWRSEVSWCDPNLNRHWLCPSIFLLSASLHRSPKEPYFLRSKFTLELLVDSGCWSLATNRFSSKEIVWSPW